MKAALICLTGAVLAAAAFPAEPKPEPPKGSLGLEGAWTLKTARLAGRPIELPANTKMSLTVTAARWTFRNETGGNANTAEYTATVNNARKPAWIDMKGRNKAATPDVIGIYKLDGDTLTLCYTTVVGEKAGRPAGFNDKGATTYLMTLKRVKK